MQDSISCFSGAYSALRFCRYSLATGSSTISGGCEEAGKVRIALVIDIAVVVLVMQFDLVRVPVECILLAQAQFVAAVGGDRYRADAAVVPCPFERDEGVARYVVFASCLVRIVERSLDRGVRDVERLGEEDHLLFVRRDDDITGAYDAARTEGQRLALSALVHAAGGRVLVEDRAGAVVAFGVSVGIHRVDEASRPVGIGLEFAGIEVAGGQPGLVDLQHPGASM